MVNDCLKSGRGTRNDLDMLDEDCFSSSGDSFERDIIMEFVLLEDRGLVEPGQPSPFKKYANTVKNKVLKGAY